MSFNLPSNYNQTLDTINDSIVRARINSLKIINSELVKLYWETGKLLSNDTEQSQYGDKIYAQLEKDIQYKHPKIRGFSARNIRRMVIFYKQNPDSNLLEEKLSKVTWTNHLEIMKLDDEKERMFYILLCTQYPLYTKDLVSKIKEGAYQNYLQNQTNFQLTVPKDSLENALMAVSDNYNLDFANLSRNHLERQLEDSIVANIVNFLGKMGVYFTFAGRQVRLVQGDDEYFLDLLFYHRQLNCLVIVELKRGEFLPEYAGKMQFYLSLADEQLKLPTENPAMGIIICGEKNRARVEYTLRDVNRPIGVSTYTYKELPEMVAKFLPSEKELEEALNIGDQEDNEKDE